MEDLAISKAGLEVLGPLGALAVLASKHALDAGDALAGADAWHVAFLVT